MPRFAAVALFDLRIELARARGATTSGQGGPILGVVIARPDGAVKDEASLLGNTRLDEVSPEAYALGVRPGQTVAAARAKTAELTVRVVPLLGVSRALEGLAEVARAFGPTSGFEAGGAAGDAIWVDVTGCAHLHARDGDGERVLAEELAAKVASMGHTCRVAVADGPRVAAAIARFSPLRRGRGGVREPVVASPGENAAAMAKLPVAALGLSDKTAAWLASLGLHRVEDVQRLPRAPLGTRLGGDAARVMALLDGDDRGALTPHVPPETPTEEAVLEHGVTRAEALLFVAKRLADRLSARLEGRCQKAARLELILALERPHRHDPRAGDDIDVHLVVVLAAPIARAAELFAVLKTKIEAQDREAPFAAPVVAVMLRAIEVVTAHASAIDLLEPESRSDRALPRLVSELSAELGHEAMGTLTLADTWVMRERSRLLPFGVRPLEARPASSFLSGGAEPTRLLGEPLVVPRASLVQARLVARFEAVEWWRRDEAASHYVAWAPPMAWVAIDAKTQTARVLGWLD